MSSVSFHPDGDRPENSEAVGEMTFDADFTGWSEEDIQGIAAPTLLTVGDCDAVRLDHSVHFLRLCGGDVNGDFVGVPASQPAVFPGTTHFSGLARTGLVRDVVLTFLDAPLPED